MQVLQRTNKTFLPHLWDNGSDAADELMHMLKVRKKALIDFSEQSIPLGEPMAKLEDVLVPVYFLHRYQTEAAVKVIGGLEYNYAVRGDGTFSTKLVDPDLQKKALEAVLQTINPAQLALDESIIQLIPPKPLGYRRNRENIKTHTGLTFDPLAAAETSVKMTMELLLNAQKCARLVELHARDNTQLSLEYLLKYIDEFIRETVIKTDLEAEIQFIVRDAFIDELIDLAGGQLSSASIRATTRMFLHNKLTSIVKDSKGLYLGSKISKFFEQPELIQPTKTLKPPDGSPIGSEKEMLKKHEFQCTSIH